MKKLFNGLLACLLCLTLVGCEEKEEIGDVGKIDLTNDNQLVCTNLKLDILNSADDNTVESWKYVIDYEDNNNDIKSWKEVYTADYSNYEGTFDDTMISKIEEKITNNFCKGRINDVTSGGYEENKDLCKLTKKDKLFTAVVTYPKETITMAKEAGYTKEKLSSELESGEYDGGFRGVYTCDKNYDITKIPNLPITGKQVTVEDNISWDHDDDDEFKQFLGKQIQEAVTHQNTNILKKYKIDITNNYKTELVTHTNNIYVFDLKLDCRNANESVCQEIYNSLYDKVLNYLLYPYGVTVR